MLKIIGGIVVAFLSVLSAEAQQRTPIRAGALAIDGGSAPQTSSGPFVPSSPVRVAF